MWSYVTQGDLCRALRAQQVVLRLSDSDCHDRLHRVPYAYCSSATKGAPGARCRQLPCMLQVLYLRVSSLVTLRLCLHCIHNYKQRPTDQLLILGRFSTAFTIYILPCISSFIHSLIHSFICSFIHSSIHQTEGVTTWDTIYKFSNLNELFD